MKIQGAKGKRQKAKGAHEAKGQRLMGNGLKPDTYNLTPKTGEVVQWRY